METRTAGPAGRLCGRCRTGSVSRMQSWVRHLHELPEGARFRVHEGDDQVFRVEEHTPASTRCVPAVRRMIKRTIKPRLADQAEAVTFEVPDGPGWRRFAPTTEVVPIPAEG